MCLNLNDYKIKTSRDNYWSTYIIPMVTTNLEPKIDMQKPKRNEHKILLKKIIKPQGKK